jgi:hypothetical protein
MNARSLYIWTVSLTAAVIAMTLHMSAAVAQQASCEPDTGAAALKPSTNIARSDVEIAAALKLAEKQDPKLRLEDRVEIVIQGVMGPCYSVTVRQDYFDISWLRNVQERPDRSEDVRMAIKNLARAAKLLKLHKFDLEGRPAVVSFSQINPRDRTDPGFLYCLFVPATLLSRAAALSPDKAEELLWNNHKLAIGDPPQEWFKQRQVR